ncbi:UNVERIFIED_CONTAM: hypothetical protein Sradi_4405200 [Sesamum radiatum]|uniref:Uncharacterized protein n=1 Tax=Sesamum radiatum TaxID=300843 RepID=A0AAW2NPN7_SESRA
MEEAVIEEKKKGEEKRKLAYTMGESSRSTKRGTGRSFSAGGGKFSRGGPAFRGNSGPRFSGPMGFIEVRPSAVHLLCLLLDQVGSWTELRRGSAFTPNCSTCGRRHLGQCWGPDAIPRVCL